MRILEQHQHGMASCHALQPALQCSKGSLLALLRVEFRLPVAITGRHRQHGGNRRDVLRRHTRRRDNGLELAQTRLVRIAARETCLLLPASHDRMQRAVVVQRRTEIPQADMRFGGDGLFQGREQARLADPWLAGQQDQAAMTGRCLPPGP